MPFGMLEFKGIKKFVSLVGLCRIINLKPIYDETNVIISGYT